MDIEGLLLCLEFQAELKELKDLGFTAEEIEGFFAFDWEIGIDLFTSLVERGMNDKH